MASTDAMRALLQRRLDSSQVLYNTYILFSLNSLSQAEAQELRQELKASDEIVNSLKVELAQLRISRCLQRPDTSDDQPATVAQVLDPSLQTLASSGIRSLPITAS